jgi:hypothetical protein
MGSGRFSPSAGISMLTNEVLAKRNLGCHTLCAVSEMFTQILFIVGAVFVLGVVPLYWIGHYEQRQVSRRHRRRRLKRLY